MKKFVALLIAVISVLSLSGCNQQTEQTDPSTSLGQTSDTTSAVTTATTESQAKHSTFNSTITNQKTTMQTTTQTMTGNKVTTTTPHTHIYSEWRITKETTCTAEGTKERACLCGAKEIQTIAKKEHNYEYGICKVCNAYNGPSISFTSNGDGTCFVSSIGSCKESSINIPIKSPSGDIVISVGASAFKNANISNILIPNTIKTIDEYAFENCSNLTSITLPDTIEYIGQFAFSDCSALKSIEIPSLSSVGASVFDGCSALQSITIPNGISAIPGSFFKDCNSLKNVTLPNSITAIRSSAFQGCSSLQSIDIPTRVKQIGTNAFAFCDSLTEVTIPSSVTQIDSCAFACCTRLRRLYILNTSCSIAANGGMGYTIEDTVTIYGYYYSSAYYWANANGNRFIAI